MCDLGTKVGHGLRDTASPLRAWASPASVPRLLLPCTHGFLEGKVSPGLRASDPAIPTTGAALPPSGPGRRTRHGPTASGEVKPEHWSPGGTSIFAFSQDHSPTIITTVEYLQSKIIYSHKRRKIKRDTDLKQS